jgi:3-hydroxyanthranilate 3,4-dioxygenase
MLFAPLQNINLKQWIEDNGKTWKAQQLVRKVLWDDSDYVTFLTSGDTTGELFHINPGDEIFYQIEGELYFYYVTANLKRELMVVRPGELFLLPANVPHAPKRPHEPCWTVVVERKRRPGESDRFAWFCEQCNHKVYEVDAGSKGPTDAAVGSVPPFIEKGRKDLLSNEKLRTCKNCGTVLILEG